MSLNGLLASVSPDWAVVMLTAGVGLIYWELNRPGTIVAGAVGLLAALLSVAVLVEHGRLNSVACLLILAGVLLLTVELRRPMGIASAAVATICLTGGLWRVLGCCGASVHFAVAAGCGVVIGAGTSVLTRIARRARTNKGLD